MAPSTARSPVKSPGRASEPSAKISGPAPPRRPSRTPSPASHRPGFGSIAPHPARPPPMTGAANGQRIQQPAQGTHNCRTTRCGDRCRAEPSGDRGGRDETCLERQTDRDPSPPAWCRSTAGSGATAPARQPVPGRTVPRPPTGPPGFASAEPAGSSRGRPSQPLHQHRTQQRADHESGDDVAARGVPYTTHPAAVAGQRDQDRRRAQDRDPQPRVQGGARRSHGSPRWSRRSAGGQLDHHHDQSRETHADSQPGGL